MEDLKNNQTRSRSVDIEPSEVANISMSEGSGCSCSNDKTEHDDVHRFVYSIGNFRLQSPDESITQELRQAIAVANTAGLSDKEVIYNTLKENRYLAKQLCWIFTVQNIDTYIVYPRDPLFLEDLIETIRQSGDDGVDTSILIGQRGEISPPHLCNGVELPIVVFDRVYSFKREDLFKSLPAKKGQTGEKDSRSTENKRVHLAIEEVFNFVQQITANNGGTDESRAINFVATRISHLYQLTSDMYEKDFSLHSIESIRSGITETRKIINVIVNFINRNSGILNRYYIAVDITNQFPFTTNNIIALQPYYGRTME